MVDCPAAEVRPVALGRRDRSQRRLIRRVTEELAQCTTHGYSFGRLVRLGHTTVLTTLPVHADGALAERRLLRACRARLEAAQTSSPRRAAA